MTQEELTKLLSVDNCEDINPEDLPVEDYMNSTYIIPNIPTFEEAVLKIDGMVLVGKSKQWLYIANKGPQEHQEVYNKFHKLTFALVSHLGITYEEGLRHSTLMKAYNNNPIDLTKI